MLKWLLPWAERACCEPGGDWIFLALRCGSGAQHRIHEVEAFRRKHGVRHDLKVTTSPLCDTVWLSRRALERIPLAGIGGAPIGESLRTEFQHIEAPTPTCLRTLLAMFGCGPAAAMTQPSRIVPSLGPGAPASAAAMTVIHRAKPPAQRPGVAPAGGHAAGAGHGMGGAAV